MKHLLFILLFSVLFSCKTTQNATQSPLKFAENPVVAHRGAWKTMNYPENSVAALKVRH
jgi:glycerophosphoryl diester phosphodiesterase